MAALVILILLAILPAAIASGRGRSFLGWYCYGILLLPIAIVHALLLSPDREALDERQLWGGMRKCPYCAEMVRGEATVCRFCGRDLSAPEPLFDDRANAHRGVKRRISRAVIVPVARPNSLSGGGPEVMASPMSSPKEPQAKGRNGHFRRFRWAYLAGSLGLMAVFALATQTKAVTTPPMPSATARVALPTAIPPESAAQQWRRALTDVSLVNSQVIEEMSAVGDTPTASSITSTAAIFASIDQQSAAEDARVQALPSVPGIDDSISNQMRAGTHDWASAINRISTGLTIRDAIVIRAGDGQLQMATAEITAAAARLKAAVAAMPTS